MISFSINLVIQVEMDVFLYIFLLLVFFVNEPLCSNMERFVRIYTFHKDNCKKI